MLPIPIGFSVNVYCAARDWRSDFTSCTPLNSCDTRESTFVAAPVLDTMLDGFTYIGRPPSLLSDDRCTPLKFTSNGVACSRSAISSR